MPFCFLYNVVSENYSVQNSPWGVSISSSRSISYHPPERKDRVGDSHGGVILYVKDTLHFTRRHDLEPVGVECLWIELNLKHKKLLFGLFYRPPSSDSAYFLSIEDSIYLAVDTGIKDIVITGDLNYNMLDIPASSKIKSL